MSTSSSPMRLRQCSSNKRQVTDYTLHVWMMPNDTGYSISMATGNQTCPNIRDSFERKEKCPNTPSQPMTWVA